MIFGIDALRLISPSRDHSFTNFDRHLARFASSNIAEAMSTDPIWGCHNKEAERIHMAQIQAVQDRFPPIGRTASRLGKPETEQGQEKLASLPATRKP